MWLIIPFFLLFTYVILILWYRKAWLDLPETKEEQLIKWKANTKVSVIVPARNESLNIANCVESILSQTYPADLLELIIMDDASGDDTALIAKGYAAKDARVKVHSLVAGEAKKSHKKRAVEKGIQLATGDLVVATDADCIHPARWIETLVISYEQNGNVFIAAPVMYHTENTICSVFQTLDFLSLQGITGASVHRRFHTMCNGANIGYSRKVFYEVKGFEGIDALPTGDDMLLMHKIFVRHPKKVVWLKSRDALVLTDAAPNWKAFFQQRIRWASKAAFFDDKRIFYVLLLVYLVNVSLLLTAFASLFSLVALKAFLLMLVIKTLAELWFLIPVAAFFSKQQWLWTFPFMQPLHIVYTVIAGWLGRFGKYEWKGRVIGKNG
jgi:cellulose synthase/poly-beta-1,6-N-acetylglucosamine synthase-like glycosyltransferase